MQTISRSALEDDFDAIVLAELERLREGEQHLKYLYPRLQIQPQLRDSFLVELAEVRQRADRLDAVLDPLGIFDQQPTSSDSHGSPAA
jgi:hypothetical protein